MRRLSSWWQNYKGHLLNGNGGAFLETQNSVLSIVIGLVFILNSVSVKGTIFERNPDLYQYMEWAPAWAWGVIYLMAGALHLFALYSKWHWHRKHIVLVKAGLWLFLALCVIQAEPFAPSGWCYLVFSYSAVMAFFRMRLRKDGPTHDNNVLAVG